MHHLFDVYNGGCVNTPNQIMLHQFIIFPHLWPKLGCTIPAAKTWKSSGWTRSKPLRSCGAFPCVSRTRALGLIRLLSNISRAYSVLISWPGETKGAEDVFSMQYALSMPWWWKSMDFWPMLIHFFEDPWIYGWISWTMHPFGMNWTGAWFFPMKNNHFATAHDWCQTYGMDEWDDYY